jgi:nucleotide-binding universal stress UspA family protein
MTTFEFKPVKKILVPTDFSSDAEHALDYACQLAHRINASVLIFHSVQIPVVAFNEMVEVMPLEQFQKKATRQLEILKRKFKEKYPDLDFEIFASIGYAVEEIVSAATSKRADLIVMGTRGASGLKEILIGSNTAEVMEKAEQPVLSVPSQARFNNFSQVVFATDYHDNDFQTLYLLATLMKPLRSKINVLHVENDNGSKLETKMFDWFKEQVTTNIPFDNFSFNLFNGSEVSEVLDNFISQNKTDLLALSMRKRNFLKKLFTRSLTKKMAYHISIPVLAFHAKTISS